MTQRAGRHGRTTGPGLFGAAAPFALTLLACAAAGPAATLSVDVGGTVIEIVPPAGHCMLDPKAPGDGRLIDMVKPVEGDVRKMTLFADCGQLEAWRLGSRPTLDRLAHLSVSEGLASFVWAGSDAAFVADVRAHFEAVGAEILGELVNSQARQIDQAVPAVSVGEIHPLSSVESDGAAVYMRGRQSLAFEEFRRTRLFSSAIVIVKGRIVQTFLQDEREEARKAEGEGDEDAGIEEHAGRLLDAHKNWTLLLKRANGEEPPDEG